jgi:hypothetical protein
MIGCLVDECHFSFALSSLGPVPGPWPRHRSLQGHPQGDHHRQQFRVLSDNDCRFRRATPVPEDQGRSCRGSSKQPARRRLWPASDELWRRGGDGDGDPAVDQESRKKYFLFGLFINNFFKIYSSVQRHVEIKWSMYEVSEWVNNNKRKH